MDEYIEISIDVFDQVGQQAKVKKSLAVSGVIDEILREFDDLDRKTPQNYALYMKGSSRPLDRNKNLDQLDIHAQDQLIFRYARTSAREPLSGKRHAFVVEESTHKLFEITWQPAIIGRPEVADPIQSELLAVNLEPFPEGRRISRNHAQITEEDGQFFIESLSPNNPTFLNDEFDPIVGRRKLAMNTRIRLGRNLMELSFLMRDGEAG